MSTLHSYSKIYALGHPAVASLLSVPVNVEEKIDGSQISFGVSEDGTLHIRSKGAVIYPEAPDAMFAAGVEEIKRLANLLHPGWVYRGEYLRVPKHNTLCYTRIPARHIILFDVETTPYTFLPYEAKHAEAYRLGLECVALLWFGELSDQEIFKHLLLAESVLGGTHIEGVVIKPQEYNLWDTDKKVLMGKYVSEAFKETHRKEWVGGSTPKDIIACLAETYSNPVRWTKAVQGLRDAGTLESSPRDIGKLIAYVQSDVYDECKAEILQDLWKWAWPTLKRRLTYGLPEWYKQKLVDTQFKENT